MSWLEDLIGRAKPVIAMAHLPPLPGAPLYDAEGGMAAIIDYVGRDLEALQVGGVDAVMFGNEGDRPYLLEASPESLAGSLSVEQNWALEAGFMDLRSGRLHEDLIRMGGITPGHLPPLRASHEVAGEVTARAAAETGLAAGTAVVAGCADHIASAFVAGMGTGAIDDWSAIDRYVQPDRVFEPEPSRLPAYRDAYNVYRDLYRRLETLYPCLGELPAA